MNDCFYDVNEKSSNISHKFFGIFYKKHIKFLFDFDIQEINIRHKSSNSKYDKYEHATTEKDISCAADEEENSSKQK
jgi:hypothetical protein